MMNGEADGIPPLPAGISRREWGEGFFAAFDDFCVRVDEASSLSRKRRRSIMGDGGGRLSFEKIGENRFRTNRILQHATTWLPSIVEGVRAL
jgi:hypothetical protein